MADASRNSNDSGSRHQSSRLQRRRPASIKISPVSSWNVAIPLLSPLATSPNTSMDLTMEIKSRGESRQEQRMAEGCEKPVVFKKWQHPAAPFCYESAPIKPRFFVPV